jgi:hypothetical protein
MRTISLGAIRTLAFIIFTVCLSACSDHTYEVNGVLCYPSEYIPKMTVYLKQTNSQKVYKLKTKENQRSFKFTNIPVGEYYCYSYTIDKILTDTRGIEHKASGGYTKAVPCGLTVDCKDHTLIKFKIDSNIGKDTINLCDFYGAITPSE